MKYVNEYLVNSHSVDCNNNIKPTWLIRYLQETANHQMRDRKPTYGEFFRAGKSFILTRIAVDVLDQIHEYDPIRVLTWSSGGKAATFDRCYSVEREGEEIIRAYSEWAVTDLFTGKLHTRSEIDLSNYESDEEIDLTIPKRFRFAKGTDFKEIRVKHVYYSEVDLNRHMTNTIYPDMLWENIPGVEEKKVTSVNMRFRREAAYGKDIHIGMTKMDGNPAKDPRAEEVWGFRTTVDGRTNVEAMFGLAKTGPNWK
ncbi:MAG: acyl-ACP thioesterase domain-containing protein [Anaerovoracaceae bacterium]|jgi:acyl-ACP thioesterase